MAGNTAAQPAPNSSQPAQQAQAADDFVNALAVDDDNVAKLLAGVQAISDQQVQQTALLKQIADHLARQTALQEASCAAVAKAATLPGCQQTQAAQMEQATSSSQSTQTDAASADDSKATRTGAAPAVQLPPAFAADILPAPHDSRSTQTATAAAQQTQATQTEQATDSSQGTQTDAAGADGNAEEAPTVSVAVGISKATQTDAPAAGILSAIRLSCGPLPASAESAQQAPQATQVAQAMSSSQGAHADFAPADENSKATQTDAAAAEDLRAARLLYRPLPAAVFAQQTLVTPTGAAPAAGIKPAKANDGDPSAAAPAQLAEAVQDAAKSAAGQPPPSAVKFPELLGITVRGDKSLEKQRQQARTHNSSKDFKTFICSEFASEAFLAADSQ